MSVGVNAPISGSLFERRRFLFRVTPRTAYWIVYRVYEDEGLVRVLQFRSTSQNDMF